MVRFLFIVSRCLFGICFQCGSSLMVSDAIITAFSPEASFIDISCLVSLDSFLSSSSLCGLLR